ncbi:MAG: hypothetical protein AABW65_03615 [Nanoarchaeota archaeon]
MTSEYEFQVEFGKSWKRYVNILKDTVELVNEAFLGSDLETKVRDNYVHSLPNSRESPIDLVIRNERQSYASDSPHHFTEMASWALMAKIAYYTSKIPFLNRVIRLDKASSELYLGQETRGYVSNKSETEGKGFGNDHIQVTVSNFAKKPDIDFDVGFDEERNYFFKINVDRGERLPIAQRIYGGIKQILEKNGIEFREEIREKRKTLKLI